MSKFEYKVVAAPTRGVKAKGAKTAEARFSAALEQMMNDLAAAGWEYQRAETLPSVERSGLASTTTNWRNVLVFRRQVERHADVTVAPPVISNGLPPDPAQLAATLRADRQEPSLSHNQTATTTDANEDTDEALLREDDLKEISDVSGLIDSLESSEADQKHKKTID